MRCFGAGGGAATLLGHCQASRPGGMREQLAPNQRPIAQGVALGGDNPPPQGAGVAFAGCWAEAGVRAPREHPQEGLHVGTCTHTQGMGCVIHTAQEGGGLKCWGYKSMLRILQAFINVLHVSSTVVYLMCCWFQS